MQEDIEFYFSLATSFFFRYTSSATSLVLHKGGENYNIPVSPFSPSASAKGHEYIHNLGQGLITNLFRWLILCC